MTATAAPRGAGTVLLSLDVIVLLNLVRPYDHVTTCASLGPIKAAIPEAADVPLHEEG